MRIGIFVCICEEDAVWLDQFFKMATDLGFDISWYVDRCSEATIDRIKSFPFTKFMHVEKEKEFSEIRRQKALDNLGNYDWAIQIDIDEEFPEGSRDVIIKNISENLDKHQGRCRLENVWKEADGLYLRKDSNFSTTRSRFYNLKNVWKFLNPQINGPYCVSLDGGEVAEFTIPVIVYHWGLSTHELRLLHKKRWDAIYIDNPYGMWNAALNDDIKILEKYDR